MDALQMTIAMHETRGPLAQSALPNAPVLADTVPALSRSRARIAVLLRRVADAVAPTDFAPAARPTLSTGGRAC